MFVECLVLSCTVGVGDRKLWHRPPEAQINEMFLYSVLEGETEAQRRDVNCLRTCRHQWQGRGLKPRTTCPTSSHPQRVPSWHSWHLGGNSCWGGEGRHRVHCGMLSSISGSHPLDAKVAPSPQVVTNKNVSSHCLAFPGGQIGPWLQPKSISPCP